MTVQVRRFIVLAAAAAVLLLAGTVALASRPDRPNGPATSWSSVSESSEDQIADVLRRAMRARAVAARTFDVSGIVANVVDDSRVPLTPNQIATLARIAPDAAPRGQLTAELAFYAHWKKGDEAFERVLKARRGGVAANQADVAAAMPRRSDPIYELPLTVHLVRVSGDQAYMEAETDAVFYRVTLVNRDGRWFIAGEDNTSKN